MFSRLHLIAFSVALAFCGGHAFATPKPRSDIPPPAEVTWTTTKIEGFDQARLNQEQDLSRYTSFVVRPATLEFNERWHRQIRREMTEADEARMKESYTKVLQEALEQALAKDSGLQQVEAAGENTLVVTPTLTDFRLAAPDLRTKSPRTENYVEHAGAARLNLTFSDGITGTPVAEIRDYSQTRSFGGLGDLKRTNRGVNLQDFKMLSKRWAGKLSRYLASATAS